jgi:hypothetical protein
VEIVVNSTLPYKGEGFSKGENNMDESKQLNPSITEIVYGKKELKKLTLYPLSVGDQFTVTNMVTEIVQTLVTAQKANQQTDIVFVATIIAALENNLGKILSLVATIPEDESKLIISDLTNTQLAETVDVVWSVNYEPALKKGKKLLERAKSMFSSSESSPSSSDFTPNTDSKTSTEKVINTGE